MPSPSETRTPCSGTGAKELRRCCTNPHWPARCQPTGFSPADAIRLRRRRGPVASAGPRPHSIPPNSDRASFPNPTRTEMAPARDHRDASPAPWLAPESRAALPAARHPTWSHLQPTLCELPVSHWAALLHESSRARTMPTDRILTGRCDTTLVGRGRSSDSGSHPGFPIWLWYFCPFDQSSSLDCRGFLERNQATEGDTQWVNYKRSPFSSRSTDF